ncbi:MAG: IS982 family transposase [Pseudomonadales bacterium]|nr:IS982 family transposase [Pseudomonadales bacterium]
MSEELLITTFCIVDDFCSSFEDDWNKILLEHSKHKNLKKPSRVPQLALSELMTITILFHSSGYRTFKDYYTRCVSSYWKDYFPDLVSYGRFVQLMKRITFPIFCLLQTLLGSCSGVSFLDSTILTVSHRCRIASHKVFKECAKRGKGTTGWFFGFKLHIVINHQGEIISFMLTPGNTSDVSVAKQLVRKCFGLLFGDKGYISSKLFNDLYDKGLKLVTKIRANMKNKLMPLIEKTRSY